MAPPTHDDLQPKRKQRKPRNHEMSRSGAQQPGSAGANRKSLRCHDDTIQDERTTDWLRCRAWPMRDASLRKRTCSSLRAAFLPPISPHLHPLAHSPVAAGGVVVYRGCRGCMFILEVRGAPLVSCLKALFEADHPTRLDRIDQSIVTTSD